MEQITLRNFRCFREKQTARLAPLTLLVGENSTGKTSFMAMIRGMWDVAYGQGAPDFKEEPYDLGSFDEIAHYRGGRGAQGGHLRSGVQSRPECHRETTTRRRQRPTLRIRRGFRYKWGLCPIRLKYGFPMRTFGASCVSKTSPGTPSTEPRPGRGVLSMPSQTSITANSTRIFCLITIHSAGR